MAYCQLRMPDGTQVEAEVAQWHYQGVLSKPYTLKLRLATALAVPVMSLVKAQLRTQYLHGVVMNVTRHWNAVLAEWQVELLVRPRLSLLAWQRQPKVYVNKTRVEMIQAFCQTALPDIEGWQFRLLIVDKKLESQRIPLLVHTAESDLAFFEQLLGPRLGFCFEQQEEGECVLITDQVQALPQMNGVWDLVAHYQALEYQDQPKFYCCEQKHAQKCQFAAARQYDPQQSQASQVALEQPLSLDLWETDLAVPLVDHTLQQALLQNQVLPDTRLLLGSYSSALDGRLCQLQTAFSKPLDQLVYRVIQEGRWVNERWQLQSRCELMPLSVFTTGWPKRLVRQVSLPGIAVGSKRNAIQQIDRLGCSQVQFPIGVLSAEQPFYCRDMQMTQTQSGGASHATQLSSEVALVSHNGLPSQYLMAGGLDHATMPSQVATANESQTLFSNRGGMQVCLRHRRPEQPFAQCHFSMTHASGQQSLYCLGASNLQDGLLHYGLQEKSTGYASKLTYQQHEVSLGKAADGMQYRFCINPSLGQTSSSESIVGDTYSDRYYASPLATASAGIQKTYCCELEWTLDRVDGYWVCQLSWLLEPKSDRLCSGIVMVDYGETSSKIPLAQHQSSLLLRHTDGKDPWQVSLQLQLASGQVLATDVVIQVCPIIRRWRWQFSWNALLQQIDGICYWQLTQDANTVEQYRLQSPQINDNQTFTVPATDSGVKLQALEPQTMFALSLCWVNGHQIGQAKTQSIMIPDIQWQAAGQHKTDLAEQHCRALGRIAYTHWLPRVHMLMPFGTASTMHMPERALFQAYEQHQPAAFTWQSCQEYVINFSSDQHAVPNRYPQSLSESMALAGNTTATIDHQQVGNRLQLHQGQWQHEIQVEAKRQTVSVPCWSRRYRGQRLLHQQGQDYQLSLQNYHRTSLQEQVVIHQQKQCFQKVVFKHQHQAQVWQNRQVVSAQHQHYHHFGISAQKNQQIAGNSINFC